MICSTPIIVIHNHPKLLGIPATNQSTEERSKNRRVLGPVFVF